MTTLATARVVTPRLGHLIALLDRHLPPAIEKRPLEFVPVWLVQECVSRSCGMPLSEMLADTREKRVSETRQIAMYIAWKMCRASLNELAREFRKKDHTTVMYACRKVAALIEQDTRFRDRVKALCDAISAVRSDLKDSGFAESDLAELVRA